MACLEVLTRTFGQRPEMLKHCRQSLELLDDPDWTQQLIVDDQARGVAWANRNLSTIEATGEWVWVLDDDDICCRSSLVQEIKQIAANFQPDVIMCRTYHAKFGWLPSQANWLQRPVLGNCGTGNVIVRRDIWNAHRYGWTEEYAGDFAFIDRLWLADLRWYWHEPTIMYYPQQSMGRPESDSIGRMGGRRA